MNRRALTGPTFAPVSNMVQCEELFFKRVPHHA